MSTKTPLHPVVVLPGTGKVLRAFGDEITVHLGGADTGGEFAMFTDVTPPGGGPPPHYHRNEEEWFLVLEGRVEFFRDGAWGEVPVGTTVFIPRGLVHTFRNCGDTPLKLLIHTKPAGFEVFFGRCADEFAKPGPPDMARIVGIAAEHGIHFVNP
ncbi:MAG: cupin domain-containing protein [Verrucomicrobia bacterium]|nr:MAG: cupin domain-containing protein [Verrucomicrobiota bacterium]